MSEKHLGEIFLSYAHLPKEYLQKKQEETILKTQARRYYFQVALTAGHRSYFRCFFPSHWSALVFQKKLLKDPQDCNLLCKNCKSLTWLWRNHQFSAYVTETPQRKMATSPRKIGQPQLWQFSPPHYLQYWLLSCFGGFFGFIPPTPLSKSVHFDLFPWKRQLQQSYKLPPFKHWPTRSLGRFPTR